MKSEGRNNMRIMKTGEESKKIFLKTCAGSRIYRCYSVRRNDGEKADFVMTQEMIVEKQPHPKSERIS